MRRTLLALCLTSFLTAGCTRTPSLPAEPGPAFNPITFFSGHTHSLGVIENRSGAPTAWIATDSLGQRVGRDRLLMIQHLSFQDGKTQQRDWTLWRTGPNAYAATANDMIGTARGSADGRMFHWRWVLARSPGNPLMDVTMSQWMYRMDDGTVTIRTTVSKFGLILAEVTEQFAHVGKT